MTTENERAQLLPCPFCGGKPIAMFNSVVECRNCKSGRYAGYPSADIETWQQRSAHPSPVDAAVERDAARWRYISRKLCVTGNGDGTCQMHAINLPHAIPGWPEPPELDEFFGSAIDAALTAQQQEKPNG